MMAEEYSRELRISEDDFLRIKQAIFDLYHAISQVKTYEYTNPEKHRVPFTQEEKRLMLDLKAQGWTVYKIAKHMGRKYGSIKNCIRANTPR